MKEEFASRFGEVKFLFMKRALQKVVVRERYPNITAIFLCDWVELNEESDLGEIFQKQIIQEVLLTVVKPPRVTRLGDPLNDRDIDNIEEK